MTSLLDVPHSPSEAALETGLDGSSLEGRIPFAFSRSRLGQVLRRLGVGHAVHRSCRGSAAVSTATRCNGNRLRPNAAPGSCRTHELPTAHEPEPLGSVWVKLADCSKRGMSGLCAPVVCQASGIPNRSLSA